MSPPTVHTFGPPTRQALAIDRALRSTWTPVVAKWRFSRRGLRVAQQLLEPRGRIPVVRGTDVEHTRIDELPGEWVTAPRARPAAGRRAVLYIHGGGFVFGSPRTHRNLVSRISHVTSMPALAIDYRLPPEHWPPAPTHDALLAYRHLLAAGLPAEAILVVGDSAGGGIALELLLHVAEAGLPMAGGLVLLSPWTDMAMTGESVRRHARLDPFIPLEVVERLAAAVVGPRDPTDWRLSPHYAPDALLAALPPTLVQVGSRELITDDARRIADRLAANEVATELQIFERHPHVVPVWGTPEARRSLREIGTWAGRHVAGASLPGAAASAEPVAAGA